MFEFCRVLDHCAIGRGLGVTVDKTLKRQVLFGSTFSALTKALVCKIFSRVLGFNLKQQGIDLSAFYAYWAHRKISIYCFFKDILRDNSTAPKQYTVENNE